MSLSPPIALISCSGRSGRLGATGAAHPEIPLGNGYPPRCLAFPSQPPRCFSTTGAAGLCPEYRAGRRFVMDAVEPVAGMLAEELTRKLETEVSFDFAALWAHDLAGRAASFKSMVAGGMDVDKAAMLSGLMGESG